MASLEENKQVIVETLLKAGADVNTIDEVSYYLAPNVDVTASNIP